MTSDLAVPTQLGTGADLSLPTVTGSSLPGLEVVAQWANAVQQVERFVTPLVDTAFVPLAHWPNPAGASLKEWPNPRLKYPKESVEEWQWRRQVAAASATGSVMKGVALGLDPYTALDQVFIVHGRPGLYVKIKWAMVVARGHELWTEDESDQAVTVCGRRTGWPADKVVRRTITIADAQRAGWTRNDAYEKTPQDMLTNRAASRVIDRIAGDVVFGLPSVEDLLDDPAPADVPASSARVTAEQILAKPLPAAEPAAPLAAVLEHAERASMAEADAKWSDREAEEVAATVRAGQQQRESERVDPQTLSAISAQFRELGGSFGDVRGATTARRRVISSIVRRGVAKAADLTADEARLVLDTLQGTTLDRAEQVLADLPGPDLDDRERSDAGSDHDAVS